MKKKLIQFKNIVKSYEDGKVVLKGIDLDIYENEFARMQAFSLDQLRLLTQAVLLHQLLRCHRTVRDFLGHSRKLTLSSRTS